MLKSALSKCLNLYRKFPKQGKASFWFLMCSFLQKGISVITTPIFTRIMTTEDYGQLSVYNSWSSIIGSIVCLNLFAGVYAQGLVKFEEDKHRYSSSLQGLCMTLTIIWAVTYFLGRERWNVIFSLTTPQMTVMLITIWLGATFSFWSVEQRVEMTYRKLVAIIFLVSVFQPLVSIIFVLNCEDKVMARIMGGLVVEFALYAWTFFAQMMRGKQFISKKYWLYALKFNIPLLPHYLSGSVLNTSDRIMISKMIGDSQAGIYNLAYSVSMIMMIFNNALLQTIEPWIYRKLKDNKVQDISKVAYPAFAMIAIINILLIVVAPEIIAIFAPPTYREGIWIIPSVALSVFFQFLYSFFATFEFYFEKTSYITCATLGGAVLNIVLNLICINQFGYIAAGYTTLICYIAYAAFHYYAMRKICKQYMGSARPYSLNIILTIGGASTLLGFSVMLFYRMPLVRYFIFVFIIMIGVWQRSQIVTYVRELLAYKKQSSQ